MVPIQITYSTRHSRCNGFFCLLIIEILLIRPSCMDKREKKEQGGTCKICFIVVGKTDFALYYLYIIKVFF